jgi:Protein of unknown function (DUF2637)
MSTRTRGERAEGLVQVVILLTIGSVAAAASFTHVHNVAAAHGQPGWLAWADAVVLELMSIATGLEIRRRHRTGRPARFVLAVLTAAVVLSLSAQVVEAERSVVGWLAAALPALGFLALVKIVLTRTPAGTGTEPFPDSVPAPAIGENDQDDSAPAVTKDLLDQARSIAAAHRAANGRDITRDALRAQLRVSSTTASELLRLVRTDARPGVLSVPADTFARTNHTNVHSGKEQ